MSKWLICFLIGSFLALATSQKASSICKSATLRTLEDLEGLRNCTVIAGHVSLVFMRFTPEALASVKPLDIEEITEYLLVYRVNGLDSLDRIFPKLLVIRGVELLYDQYGLVVLENRDLENIGLVALLRVLKGSIRVELNPSLCYTHTVNWVSIMGNTTKKYHYVLKNNKSPNYCPLCYGTNPTEQERHRHCWSLGKLQQQPLANYTDQCSTECPSKKCNKKGKCCSGNCLTSCSDDNCRYCSNLINGKNCVNHCTQNSLAFKRQCVMDCHQYGLIHFGGECVEACPKFYREIKQHGIVTGCSSNCSGNFTIKTSRDLEGFADSDCTTLQGSLTLELRDINKTNVKDLDEAFSNLREITGYLKIVRSPQLVSLNFLHNLHTIAGKYLIDNVYALYVVDNHHLEDLWNSNQKVSIPKGRVYFHLNPRLCSNKITELGTQLKVSNISIMDVSPNSNGERVICDANYVRELNVSVEATNANEVRICTDLLTPDELTLLIGYIYYYREAPQRNMTKYEGRDGCGQDNWYMDVTTNKSRRHVFRDLKPNTQYAYYVQTLTIIDYVYQLEAVSEIQYFRTDPAKPGPLEKIYYRSLSASEIEIHWWPPRQKNGVIEKYVLKYNEATPDNTTTAITRNPQQSRPDVCNCPKSDAAVSGPKPIVEDFYIWEQMVFEEGLTNFIYVPKDTNATSKKKVNYANEENFLRAQEEIVMGSIREQERGKEDFDITPLLPVCNVTNPSMSYKKENNCTDLELIERDCELSGDTHSFTLKQLQPQAMYRISIRACVEGLENGCGPETVLWAETVSKRLETFLEGLKMTPETTKEF